jgi:hypothetical protein
MHGKMKNKIASALSLAIVLALIMAPLAFADNTIPDGDGMEPVNANPIDFGTVCSGSTTVQTALIRVNRNGAAGSTNVFKDGSIVTISVLAVSGAGLSAVMSSPNTITLPSNWGDLSNNSDSDYVSSDVTFVAGSAGSFSGSVTYRGSGVNSSNSTINRDATMAVTATIVDCAPTDTTPPKISYELNPAFPDGNNGWYKSNVTLTWTVTEDESPDSLVKIGCEDQSITSDQDETTYSCSATSDGGSAGPVEVTIKRDATPPAVTVTGVSDGATYILGSVPAAGCDTQDATSGVATEASLSSNGGPVGSITTTCGGAEDYAGNAGSASVTYSVIYDWDGFFRPVDNLPDWNLAKAGSAIPVKFSLAGDQGLGIFSTGYPKVQQIACDASANPGAIEETVTAGSSSLTYDASAGQYIYVWKTEKAWANTCRQFTIKLVDETTHSFKVNFTK